MSAGTGIALSPHSILLFGGDKGETFHQAETLIAAIADEKNEEKKQQLNQQKIQVQASHPGFSNQVLEYNTLHETCQILDSIPFPSPVTTVTFPFKNYVIIPSGEIKAGVRSPHILWGKMKSDKK